MKYYVNINEHQRLGKLIDTGEVKVIDSWTFGDVDFCLTKKEIESYGVMFMCMAERCDIY